MKGRHSRVLNMRQIAATIAVATFLIAPAVIVAGPFDEPPDGSEIKSASKAEVKAGSKGKAASNGVSAKAKRTRFKPRPLPANDRRDAKYLRDLGEGYKIAHTQHYTIFYNTPDEDIKAFTIAVEKVYSQVARYVHKLGIELKEPKYKLVTHYFDTFEQYRYHANRIGHGPVREGKLGFYVPVSHTADQLDPGDNMSYFYNVRNTPWFRAAKKNAEAIRKQLQKMNQGGRVTPAQRKAMKEASRQAQAVLNQIKNLGDGITESTLQHEVTHQVLFNVGFHNYGSAWANPRWLAEGMAQIFETPSDGNSWGFMLTNKEKLREFRRLQEHDALVPLRSFVSDPRWFFRPDAGSLAYPQSWAMLHYISRKHRDELRTYVNLINARPVTFKTTPEKEIEIFEKAFGPLDETWERRWLGWMKAVRE